MIIRRASESDFAEIISLYSHLHDDDANGSEEQLREIWKTIMHSDRFIYLVAEANNVLVGTCNVSLIPNLTRGGRSIALIENVVTHKYYRRRGIGRALIGEALNIARDSNCYKAMLMTSALRKEARQFYESLGFSSTDKVGFVMKL
jgi:N-acetylglutamate synthase-like GNAT family acetyltransferase